MAGGPMKVLLVALALVVALHLQERYEIKAIADDATAMEPSISRRATKVFATDGRPPPRGAVVWFEHPAHPGRMLLSRVVGVPGDRIAIEAGRAVRDGRPLAEDHVEKRVELESLEETLVPDGYVYVLNDVRGDPGSPSTDSRRLGPVPAAFVVGRLGDKIAEREAASGGGESGARGAGRKAGGP